MYERTKCVFSTQLALCLTEYTTSEKKIIHNTFTAQHTYTQSHRVCVCVCDCELNRSMWLCILFTDKHTHAGTHQPLIF